VSDKAELCCASATGAARLASAATFKAILDGAVIFGSVLWRA
jgi:hypothetical protein